MRPRPSSKPPAALSATFFGMAHMLVLIPSLSSSILETISVRRRRRFSLAAKDLDRDAKLGAYRDYDW